MSNSELVHNGKRQNVDYLWSLQTGGMVNLPRNVAEERLALVLPNKRHNKKRSGPVDTEKHIPVSTPSIFMLGRPSQNRQRLN